MNTSGAVIAHHGYVGLRLRDRCLSAAGGLAVIAAVAALLLWTDARPVFSGEENDRSLQTFHLPLPPPEPPPTPEPPAARLVEREASPVPTPPRASRAAGGTPGRASSTPIQIITDAHPPVLAAPPSPILEVDSAPPSAGREAGDGLGGDGGEGTGVGSGSGAGDGLGGGGAIRYARTDWIIPPSRRDYEREWPRFVPKLTVPLYILLECHVTAAGRLQRCKVLRDDPYGHGYGRAAIRMVAYTRVRPVTRNGKRVDIPVLVPFTFQPVGQPNAAPTPAPSSP